MKSLCLSFLLLAPTAAHADWREYQTRHFTIYSEGEEREVTQFAERLEQVDKLLRMATNASDDADPVPVRIYVVASTAEVERALGMTGTGIAGFYTTNALGPYAVTPRKTYFGTGRFTPELVLHHEYSHHFMLQYFPSTYPQWYVEGFAELIGSSGFMPDGRVAYGQPARHRGDAIAYSWVPLSDLLTKPAAKIYNLDLYGQGWAVTHFLTMSKERSPQLRQYLLALQQGKTPADAVKAFGDMNKLNQEARAYVQAGSYPYRPVALEVPKPVVTRTRILSSGEAALVPETISFSDEPLDILEKEKDRLKEQRRREDNLGRIREKAARFPNDTYALYLLGEAESSAGNHARAEQAADRLLSTQPNHARGMIRKGMSMLQSAKTLQPALRGEKAAEARQWVLRANRADPNDPLPLLALYQTYQMAGQKAPAAAVTALIQAVNTLPQDEAARQLLVDELASQKRWMEAVVALRPIANSSHASPRRAAAQKQLERLLAELAKQAPTGQDQSAGS